MVLEVYVLARRKLQDPRSKIQGYLARRPILTLSCTDWNWFDGKGHSLPFNSEGATSLIVVCHFYIMLAHGSTYT